jgi:two-component system response regulator AtoC
VEIPSLRQRKDEILGLAQHLLQKHANEGMRIPELSPSLKQALLNHDWPGNIRELENVMRQLLVIQDSDTVCMELQRTRRKLSSTQSSVCSSNYNKPAALPAVSAPDLPGDAQRQIAGPAPAGAMSSEGLIQTFEQSPSNLPSPHMLEKVDEYKRNAEANVILSALKTTRWNRRQAADLLKVDYKALLYKMKKLKISA